MANGSENHKIYRALISVSDKTGVVSFARQLQKSGIEIISTGGTGKLLQSEGVRVIEIQEYTGFPEIMGGRVKTLHPKIYGGILARSGEDETIMSRHDIPAIDLVVVNLYPFAKTIQQEECTLNQAIEQIDIGGPAMIRGAAKNHKDVAVVVDPLDYEWLAHEIAEHQMLSREQKFKLAAKAFSYTAAYDGLISNYLTCLNSELDSDRPQYFSSTLNLQFEKVDDMRYGENPHQKAAFYRESNPPVGSIVLTKLHQGKALSHNNVADADAALECIKTFSEPACVIVKHSNPCGVALGSDINEAYNLAYATDPTSSFGGIIAFNKVLDEYTARSILGRQFVEVILAPEIAENALSILKTKSNIRVLSFGSETEETSAAKLHYKKVNGGLLVQSADSKMLSLDDMKVVTERLPTESETRDLMFAWKVVKYVKSNAIVYAKNGQTIGIGAGQMSRVYSAKIAAMKANDEGLEVKGSVMASDAFFPFRDGIDIAVSAGVTAIIQPGGSMQDPEVIDAANEAGLTMVFTGTRHFSH